MRKFSFLLIFAIMASARLMQTVAALAPPYKRQYTVILATSRKASPTFLHQIQQSSLTPLFIGEHSIFFRKAPVSDWGWSHIFLFPGEDVKLDSSFNLRQSWGFTVDADVEFAKDEGFDGEVVDQHGLMRASGCGIEEPQDLAESLKYWYRPSKNRLWVLNFLNFAGPDALGLYEEHLAEKQEQCGLKVHLFGKVRQTRKMERSQQSAVEDVKVAEAFALLSFPGEQEYAGFLMSEEHQRLVKRAEREGKGPAKEDVGPAGVVEEGMILTKELRLPPKDEVINRHEWHYGNPYEPFGEDWFG